MWGPSAVQRVLDRPEENHVCGVNVTLPVKKVVRGGDRDVQGCPDIRISSLGLC
jgi:hypothetical protein